MRPSKLFRYIPHPLIRYPATPIPHLSLSFPAAYKILFPCCCKKKIDFLSIILDFLTKSSVNTQIYLHSSKKCSNFVPVLKKRLLRCVLAYRIW